MTNFTPEMIEKAKAAKSAEELLALAKESNVEITAEEANTYFAQLNPKSGELSDDELDNVAGGGCHSGDGRLVVTIGYCCSNWTCTCGSKRSESIFCGRDYITVCSSCGNGKSCQYCKYMSYERGLWLCNNPANKG